MAASLAFAFQQEPVTENNPGLIDVVVIDAGHGGHDIGTRGKTARESRTTLKIALALGKKIKAEMPEVKVLYTRTSDVFVELDERSAYANRNRADLFISIHCNSSPNSSRALGTETYVMGLHKSEGNLEVAKRENSAILKEKDYKEKYKGYDPTSPLSHIMLANYQSAFMSSSCPSRSRVAMQSWLLSTMLRLFASLWRSASSMDLRSLISWLVPNTRVTRPSRSGSSVYRASVHKSLPSRHFTRNSSPSFGGK